MSIYKLKGSLKTLTEAGALFMNEFLVWFHQLQKAWIQESVLVKSCLMLSYSRRLCNERHIRVILVATLLAITYWCGV